MELIDEPVPLIGEIMVGVEQLAKAVHIVFLPVSIVVAPLLVVELALAVTHAIKFLALVPAPIFVLLNSILLILVFASGLLAELGYDRDRVDGMDLVIGVDGVLVMFLVIRSNFVRIEWESVVDVIGGITAAAFGGLCCGQLVVRLYFEILVFFINGFGCVDILGLFAVSFVLICTILGVVVLE